MTGKLLAGFIVAFLLPGSASAALVTWVFEGQVRAIQDSSPATLATLSSLGVVEGSAYSGRLVFETSTPDEYPGDPGWGSYRDAIVTFELTMGSYHPSTSLGSTSADIIVDPGPGGPYDFIQARGGDYGYGLLIAPLLTFALRHEGAPIWSDALPLIQPELADLSPFILGGGPMGAGTGIVVMASDGTIYGDLTVLEVPEPTVLALLAPLALLATHVRGRSERRS